MPAVLHLSSSSVKRRSFHQVSREYVGLGLGCDQDVSHSDAHLHSSRTTSYVSSTDNCRSLTNELQYSVLPVRTVRAGTELLLSEGGN